MRRDPTASKTFALAIAAAVAAAVSVATAVAAAASATAPPASTEATFGFPPPSFPLLPRRDGVSLPAPLRPFSASRARRGRGWAAATTTTSARAAVDDRRRARDDVGSDGFGVGAAASFGDDDDDEARRGRGRGERRGRVPPRPRGTDGIDDGGGDERERGRVDLDGFVGGGEAGRRRGAYEEEASAGRRRRHDDRRVDHSDCDDSYDLDYDDDDYYYGARRAGDGDGGRWGRQGRERRDEERDARASSSDGRSDDDGVGLGSDRDRDGHRGGGERGSDVPSGSESKRRAGHYDVYFDNRYGRYYDPEEDERDEAGGASRERRRQPRWETHGSTSVLLPPPDVDPSSIVHFVGGTLFGSLPVQFYGPMLEGVARRTDSVVVATPVPVTIDGNPLDHLRLAERICEGFRGAYEDVVSDEYGPAVADGLPIVGIGHSLGARIQTLICTDARLTRGGFEREGNVLISFNNYNAEWSVPGVKSLRDRSEDVEREAEEGRRRRNAMDEERRAEGRPRRGARYRSDDLDYDLGNNEAKQGDFFGFREGDNRDGYRSRSRRREDPPNGERRRPSSSSSSSFWDRHDDNDDDLDEDDEEDYDLRDLLDDLRSSVAARTSTIRAALTPRPSRLEFRPAPRRLWDALERGRYGESVRKTLVVQFDRDEIDQGSRLARSVVAAAKAREVGPSPSEASDLPSRDDGGGGGDERRAGPDVKFARLSGTHLTPVSLDGETAWGGSILRLASSASDAMLAVLTAAAGEEEEEAAAFASASRPRDERRRKRNEADDLVSTVSIWMEEIVLSKRN